VQSKKNLYSLTKEFHLSKVNYDAKDAYRDDVSLNDNQLKIGFFDIVTGGSAKIQVEDDNITFAKGQNTKFLKEYGIATNEDGTLQLDFEVNHNVKTEFVFNDNTDVYEVHLSSGTASESSFSKTIEVSDTGVLKIDFVNHKTKLLGKVLVFDTDTALISKLPRIIISFGGDLIE